MVATGVAGNSSSKAIEVLINNLDEVAPTITSGDTADTIKENTVAGQVVYTATATDDEDISGGVTYSLSDENDDHFVIDETSGEVTLLKTPDFETRAILYLYRYC